MRPSFDRRAFFAVSASSVLGAVAGCAPPASGARTAAPGAAVRPPIAARTKPVPKDWSALREGLAGRLIRPGDAAYDAARRLYNPRFDGVRPAGVAYCANASDVAECLAFARRTGVPVAARSGGHSYAGWSSGTGLIVDVARMNGVSAASGRAVVGAGAQLIDVYDRLAAEGVSIPAGSCPTVGVAGLTLGGGIGVVARKYGLTCDVLESVQIVTADGRVRTCDANHDADLYWASRGGGGGNFGVAVSFTFRTHPTSDVTVFFLHWPWSMARKAVAVWQQWAPAAPDALWANLHLGHDPAPSLTIGGLYLGPRAACEKLLDPLIGRIGGRTTGRSITQTTYLQAMKIMGGCAGRTLPQCHVQGTLPGRTREGTFPRDDFRASSHLAYRPLPASGIAGLVGQAGSPGRHSILLDALGGKVGRVRPDATAYPHRQALFSVQYYAHRDGAAAWVRAARAAMTPHFGEHAYVNYIDPALKNWRRQYYGGNATRLAKVKAAYDPDRLFRFPQAV
ncbi:FAD-binding oxidoreductase [Sphaerisporangium rubeum]|uniref:FAD/FMN-containing dehydrogenase n=1 Tax=Sphaerisporangium rubeum TaxID=321317 RepID=A0A7X0IBN9_9ACTN|nr:FAD/FMN-containing dehydrogenase [Sphaerisporangium rubeum]